jgi:hypothetical protein
MCWNVTQWNRVLEKLTVVELFSWQYSEYSKQPQTISVMYILYGPPIQLHFVNDVLYAF